MAKVKQKKSNSRLGWYLLLFIVFLLVSLLWTMPLSVVNLLLPKNTKLLNVSGSVHHGRWQDVEINGKRYPLSCEYQRQSLSFSGVTYALNCDTPLAAEATLSVSPNGDAVLTDGLISGDISEASPWFALLGVPVKVSGEVGATINQARLESQTLIHLDISGGSQQIRLFDKPLINQLRIETLNKQLSAAKPIVLEIRTQESDVSAVQLYATSEIDGKQYVTRGEISGKQLANYATVLQFFGQQTGNNRFAIQLQGNLF